MKAFYAILLLYFAVVHSLVVNDTIKDVKSPDNENSNTTVQPSPSLDNSTLKNEEDFTNHSQSKNSTRECDQQQNLDNNATFPFSSNIQYTNFIAGVHLCHFVFYSIWEILTILSFKGYKYKLTSANTRFYFMFLFMTAGNIILFFLGLILKNRNLFRIATFANYVIIVELGWVSVTESYTCYSLLKKYGFLRVSPKGYSVKHLRILAAPLISVKIVYIFFILWPLSFSINSGFGEVAKVSDVMVTLQYVLIPTVVQVLILGMLGLFYDLGVRHHAPQQDRMIRKFGKRFRQCLYILILASGSVLAQLVALTLNSFFNIILCLNLHMMASLLLLFTLYSDIGKKHKKLDLDKTPAAPKKEAIVQKAVQP